jgi:hypothetical protein
MDVIRQTVYQLEAAHTAMKQKYVYCITCALNDRALMQTLFVSPGMRTRLRDSRENWRRVAARMATAARHRRNPHLPRSGTDPGICSAV